MALVTGPQVLSEDVASMKPVCGFYSTVHVTLLYYGMSEGLTPTTSGFY